MRKNASAPSLVNLTTLSQTKAAGQHAAGQTGSAIPHRNRVEGKAGERLGPIRRGGSHPLVADTAGRISGRSKAGRTQALSLWTVPPSSLLDEVDQLAMDAFQPSGLLGSSECLEMYGKVASAPDLRTEDVPDDSQQQPPAPFKRKLIEYIQGRPEVGGDERLAECLATPATVDDKNLGEAVDDEAKQARRQTEMRTQLRYAMETQLQEEEEQDDARDARADLNDPDRLETPHQARQRRRRRPSEDVYAYLHALGINVEPSGNEPTAKGDALSPESRAAMAELFASIDDTSNRLHLELPQAPAAEGYIRRMRIAPSPSFRLEQESPSRQSLHA